MDPLSTFGIIYPIGMKLGTYNKLHLYFQLSETTRYLIGFQGNDSQIDDVPGGRHVTFEGNFLFVSILLFLNYQGGQPAWVYEYRSCLLPLVIILFCLFGRCLFNFVYFISWLYMYFARSPSKGDKTNQNETKTKKKL